VIHLNERECSAQRRYQKVLEESPSPFLTPGTARGDGCRRGAGRAAIDYATPAPSSSSSVPTARFYFMEINTRLQVEHPVTEMVTGLDLVEWQLRIAAGEQAAAGARNRSGSTAMRSKCGCTPRIRSRLPARLRHAGALRLPAARAMCASTSGVVEGDTVTIFYDPMIAKLIVHGTSRPPAALARCARRWRAATWSARKSTSTFLERLVRHPAVVEASIDTGYLDRHLDEVLSPALTTRPHPADRARRHRLACDCARKPRKAQAPQQQQHTIQGSPWAIADAWRLGHGDARVLVLEWRGTRIELQVLGSAGCFEFRHDGQARQVRLLAADETALTLELDGQPQRVAVLASGGDLIVHAPRRYRFHPARPYGFEGTAGADSMDRIRAPMPGRIVAVQVAQGERVQSQQALLVMEAMKMELTLRAPQAATVAELRARVGDFVEADTVLVRFEEDA
jgi:3-methylcrotonyl-CoA carboxylase alpha subunit